MSPPEVLAADSVVKTFGERTVLSAASVWVRAGMVTALFGRNGCGKSTLLRIAAGLVRADFAVVRFQGRHVRRPRLHRLARAGLFYLTAEHMLSRRLTLAGHFDLLRRRFGLAGEGEVLERLGVAHLLGARPGELSGGEQRRAELALAVLRRPVCLLADEPFLGITPKDIEVVAAELRALARSGCGVLAAGHEVPALLGAADHVVWMTAGTTHQLGAPAEALASHGFRRDYLGPGSFREAAAGRK